MCTVELARRLDLGLTNLRLETLAGHWGISQMRPHDALDDAMVLAQILKPVLVRARERRVWLPVHPVTRRSWPNGRVTHDELHPLKVVAARRPCPYANPGRFVPQRPLVQGMRVGLAGVQGRTYEEVLERILHAGLAYTDTVDQHTSLIVCDEKRPEQGKGYQAAGLGDHQCACGNIPLLQAEFEEAVHATGCHPGQVQCGGARAPQACCG